MSKSKVKQRIHFLPSYFFNPYDKITISIIGCGGTGSRLLHKLISIDISLRALNLPGIAVTVVDYDRIAIENIGRQLFFAEDIGKYKSEVLIKMINKTYGFDWKYKTNRVDSGTKMNANILITCVDDAGTRIAIHDAIKKRGNDNYTSHTDRLFYWIDTGNSFDSGQIVCGSVRLEKQPKSKQYETVEKIPNIMEKYSITSFENTANEAPSCSLAMSLNRQDLFINDLVASLTAHLLWTILKGRYLFYHGFFLNTTLGKVTPILV